MRTDRPTWGNFLQHLRIHEGFRSQAYQCSEGYLTIGYGRKIEGDKGLSQEEAEFLLSNDAREASDQLLKNVNLPDNITIAQRMALTAMVFQLGIGTFKKFKKMIAAVERGEWAKAADEALDSRWAIQTPRRAQEVAEILRTGFMEIEHE